MSIPTSSPNITTVSIDTVGGLGDGLARLNGKPVYVPKSCAGDTLKIEIISETREFARGEIMDVITPGPERRTPPCPHFSLCGGCSMQQLLETAYRKFKQEALATAISYGGYDLKAGITFLPAASRRRVELKIAYEDGDLHFAYYAAKSRDLVPINQCLILAPELQALLAPLAARLSEWKGIGAIYALTLTLADSGIDLVLMSKKYRPDTDGLSDMAAALNINRISLEHAERKPIVAIERKPVSMRLGEFDVNIPPNVFLQASREGQRLLTEAVLAGVGSAKSVADLFSGIGTYSFPLSKTAHVHAVEFDAEMVQNLKAMAQLHGLHRRLSGHQRDLFKDPLTAKELEKFDAIILNPPRPGAKAQCEEIAKSGIKKVVMVSCNPATFSRDAKTLKTAGFSLESAQGIDQFVYSPHLEIVAIFSR